MRNMCISLIVVGLMALNANAITVGLEEFTGDDASATATFTDQSGFVAIDLSVQHPSEADITGFWFDVADESLLGTFQVHSSDTLVLQFAQSVNNVNNLGGGVNLNGGGTPAPLDIGIRFEKPGDGSQLDVSFVLKSSTGPIDAAGLLDSDGEFGLRLQATNGREGSSKLFGPTRIPETGSTVLLLGMSLFGLGLMKRK